LYAISRGTGLGGAPDEDELVVHENVVVAVEVDELAAAEVDVEVDEDALIEAAEDIAAEVLEALIAELTEEDVDEPLLLSARYAAVPPTASTTITTTAMTA
jgi:hypothetical protein